MFGGDVIEDVVKRRVDQGSDIVPSDRQVGLGEGHLDVRDERAEELPVAVHLCEDVAMTGLDRRLESGTDTEPAGMIWRDWVQPNTQGIARRSERSPPPCGVTASSRCSSLRVLRPVLPC